MSVFRYKGSKVWTMDFVFHAQRIRESTGMTSKTRVKEVRDKRKKDLREGAAGIKKPQRLPILSYASETWLDLKKPH
jgi:hypothetical protein